jgi:hypothetical protein
MSKIKFYEKSHKYKLGRKDLTSVTTFIGQFFPKFDGKALARKLSKFPHYRNKGMGMRKIMAEWKATAEHGTEVHNAIECFINTADDLYAMELFCKDERSIAKYGKWLEWWYSQNVTEGSDMFAEEIIYDEELGLAGTIDFNFVTKEGKTYLMDWKTNTNFTKNYDKSNAFEPIEHLPNTKLSKYQLQLSLYAYMLERKGAKIGGLVLVEVGEDKVKEYEVEYLKGNVRMAKTKKLTKTQLLEKQLKYALNRNKNQYEMICRLEKKYQLWYDKYKDLDIRQNMVRPESFEQLWEFPGLIAMKDYWSNDKMVIKVKRGYTLLHKHRYFVLQTNTNYMKVTLDNFEAKKDSIYLLMDVE